MASTNIPAGFCDKCGRQIFVGKKFCNYCGNPINAQTRLLPLGNTTTISDLKIAIPVTPPANVPTPPQIIKNPDDLQVHQAAVADINPYASWGKLILNGSTDKIIQEYNQQNDDSYGKYFGGVFRLRCGDFEAEEASYYKPNIHMLKGGSSKSFAFQALLRKSDTNACGGLVFLSDAEAEVYYAFIIYQSGNESKYAVMNETQQHIREGTCAALRATEPNLLGVVVQEPGILDMYINLVHVVRMHDSSLMDNNYVGCCAFNSDDSFIYISHPKIWMKK